MTIAEMRTLLSMPEGDFNDAQVVAAYAALVDDGIPASIEVVEPVSVEQARQQCRLDDDIEDALIAQKISSAREWVEDYTGLILARRTMVAHFDQWGRYLELLARPIVSIDAIAFTGEDVDGTYAAARYSIGINPLRIFSGAGGFPSLRVGGRITVAFTAGYEPAEAPQVLREAVLVLVAGMMTEREGAYDQSLKAATAICDRRRTMIL